MKIRVIDEENKRIKKVDVTNNEFKSIFDVYLKDRPICKGAFITCSQWNYDYLIGRRLKTSRKKLKRRK